MPSVRITLTKTWTLNLNDESVRDMILHQLKEDDYEEDTADADTIQDALRDLMEDDPEPVIGSIDEQVDPVEDFDIMVDEGAELKVPQNAED